MLDIRWMVGTVLATGALTVAILRFSFRQATGGVLRPATAAIGFWQ